MSTNDCITIVSGFGLGRMIGASERAAIREVLAEVERLKADNERLQSMVTLWIERACQIQSTEQVAAALPSKDAGLLNLLPCTPELTLTGLEYPDWQTQVAGYTQPHTESSPQSEVPAPASAKPL